MAFPETPLPTLTELFIGGAWVNATATHPLNGVRGEGGNTGITITRGVTDQQSRVSAQTSTFTLNNRDGIWSSRNPLSPYYGLITRNIPVRHSVTPLDNYLKMPADNLTGYVSTADKASLDILGDIDIRIEVEPKSWRPPLDLVLAAKYRVTGDQRSWVLRMTPAGILNFSWSTTGTFATTTSMVIGTAVPVTSTRLAIRAFLDVDNGAGSRVLTIQTAPSINGAYTTLGTTTTAGVTSIYSSTTDLEIGSGNVGAGVFSGSRTFWGRIHAFQLRNSAGTLVADIDFSTVALGTTSFADAYGNTWAVNSRARIGSDRVRYVGELAELPHRWDKSGVDVRVPVVAAGLLRRLGQGAKALRSPIYRSFTGYGNVAGYWPLEDGSDATVGANVVPGGAPASGINLAFGASAAETLYGTEGAVRFEDSTSRLRAATIYIAPTGAVSFLFYFRMVTLPATDVLLMRLYLDGYWDIKIGPTGYTFEGYNPAGTLLATATTGYGPSASPLTTWVGMRLVFTQEGGNIRWQTTWYGVGTAVYYTHLAGGSTYAGTLGRSSGFQTSANAAFTDMTFAHILITQDFVDLETSLARAADGYTGERAATRFARLCSEEGVPYDIDGEAATSEPMGPQRAVKLLDLLQDVVDVDMGLMGECRDILALSYRTRADMQGNAPIELDYSAGTFSELEEATDDDRYTANDVTVTRKDGSAARVEIAYGPLSVRDPTDSPPGAGRYETDITVNASTDEQLPGLAGWRALLGSIDQVRIPGLEVALHRQVMLSNTELTRQIIKANVGDAITMTNPPFWLGAEDVRLLTYGYDERLSAKNWTFKHNTAPGDPFSVPVYNGGVLPVARYDTSDTALSYIAGSITSSSGLMVVSTPCELPNEALWTTDPAQLPLDIMAAGERMTVTALSSNVVSDSFSRVTANGWGSADSGQAWTGSGGVAADFSTNGSLGLINMSTTSTAREMRLTLAAHPFEVLVGTMNIPVNLTGVGAQGLLDVQMCRVGVNTFIRFRVFQGTAGVTSSCTIEQVIGGASVALDTTFPSTGTVATTAMSARVQVTDTVARARVWAAGTTEPLGTWTTQVTLVAAVAAGDIVLAAERGAASTNAAPFYANFDNVLTPRMQAFAVTRAVNGISKAHVPTPRDYVHVFDTAYWSL